MHNLQFFHISNTFGCRTTSIFEEEVLFPQSGGNTGPIPLSRLFWTNFLYTSSIANANNLNIFIAILSCFIDQNIFK